MIIKVIQNIGQIMVIKLFMTFGKQEQTLNDNLHHSTGKMRTKDAYWNRNPCYFVHFNSMKLLEVNKMEQTYCKLKTKEY